MPTAIPAKQYLQLQKKKRNRKPNDLKLVSSNWLGSNVHIDILQSEDRATKAIHCPTVVTSDKELDILLKQWTLLKVKKTSFTVQKR